MAVRDCGDESCTFYLFFICSKFRIILIDFFSVIHVFDLIPGSSRQNEVTTCHTKTIVQQIAVSRAGSMSDQYMVFIDTNRDIFCTSLKNDSNFTIYKIGSYMSTYLNAQIEKCK